MATAEVEVDLGETTAITELIVRYETSTKIVQWARNEDLFVVLKQKFDIPSDAVIVLQRNNAKYDMFIDIEDGDLGTLTDGTVLKVVMKPSTVVMDLVPVEESASLENLSIDESLRNDLEPLPLQDLSNIPQVPSTSTSGTASPLACVSNKAVWPDTFTIPCEKFTVKLETELRTLKSGEGLSWDAKREFIRHITDKIFSITCYPQGRQIQMVAQAIVTQYPVLRDRIGSGIDSWIQGVREGMRNARRNMKTPEVMARKRKTAAGEIRGYAKIPKKGEMVWAPVVPEGEDDLSHDRHCSAMKSLIKSRDSGAEAKISSLMEVTFAQRRQYVLHERAQMADIKKRYPALFNPRHLMEEFHRINGVDLEKQFISGLLSKTGPLLLLAEKQRGTRHQKRQQNEKQKKIRDLLLPLGSEMTTDQQKQITALLLLPVLLQDKGPFIRVFPVSTIN